MLVASLGITPLYVAVFVTRGAETYYLGGAPLLSF